MNEAAVTALALRKIVPENILRDIVHKNGTLAGLLGKSFDELFHSGLDLKSARTVAEADTKEAEASLKRLQKAGGRLMLLEDEDYPSVLKETFDPPLCLYILGNVSCLNDLCIGMVGARKASTMGADMAKKLAGELARAGITVVSGFAYGIDIAAHLGALNAGGSTAAVLGSGLADIYPKNHKKYIDDICRDGCILTELDPDEPPMPHNFPKRNRVISGLSRGIVVVEASPRSGSLITSRLALEQGREVFAVPTSPLFGNNATNSLIKDGAILTEGIADILPHFEKLIKSELKSTPDGPDFDSEEEKLVFEELSVEPLSADEIVMRTKIQYSELAAILMEMELADRIKKGDDGKYTVMV